MTRKFYATPGEAPGKSDVKVYLKIVYTARQASHCVPESWLSKGNDRWQALTGVNIGQAIELRKLRYLGADGVPSRGRRNGRWRYGKLPCDPAESKTLNMYLLYLAYGTVGDPDGICMEW